MRDLGGGFGEPESKGAPLDRALKVQRSLIER